jgi:hypothetical protein
MPAMSDFVDPDPFRCYDRRDVGYLSQTLTSLQTSDSSLTSPAGDALFFARDVHSRQIEPIR